MLSLGMIWYAEFVERYERLSLIFTCYYVHIPVWFFVMAVHQHPFPRHTVASLIANSTSNIIACSPPRATPLPRIPSRCPIASVLSEFSWESWRTNCQGSFPPSRPWRPFQFCYWSAPCWARWWFQFRLASAGPFSGSRPPWPTFAWHHPSWWEPTATTGREDAAMTMRRTAPDGDTGSSILLILFEFFPVWPPFVADLQEFAHPSAMLWFRWDHSWDRSRPCSVPARFEPNCPQCSAIPWAQRVWKVTRPLLSYIPRSKPPSLLLPPLRKVRGPGAGWCEELQQWLAIGTCRDGISHIVEVLSDAEAYGFLVVHRPPAQSNIMCMCPYISRKTCKMAGSNVSRFHTRWAAGLPTAHFPVNKADRD